MPISNKGKAKKTKTPLHKRHISTKTGIIIIGLVLLVLVLPVTLYQAQSQQSTNNAEACSSSVYGTPGAKSFDLHVRSTCGGYIRSAILCKQYIFGNTYWAHGGWLHYSGSSYISCTGTYALVAYGWDWKATSNGSYRYHQMGQ